MFGNDFLGQYNTELTRIQNEYQNNLNRLRSDLNQYQSSVAAQYQQQYNPHTMQPPIQPQTLNQQTVPQNQSSNQVSAQNQPANTSNSINVQMLGVMGEMKVLFEDMNKKLDDLKNVFTGSEAETEKEVNKSKSSKNGTLKEQNT